MLEEVLSHQFRDDIYIDKVISTAEEIKSEDKNIIIKILYDELQSLTFH
ncbi:MAG: hypothetical protein ACTSXH_13340 [Promethearchaeota archaeon]